MRTFRLVLAAFVIGAVLAAAPIATALPSCRSIFGDGNMTCYLVGEDEHNCYYNCWAN